MSETALPSGWAECALEEIALWGSGGTPSRKNTAYFGGDIPWIKTGELGDKYVKRAEEHISEAGLTNSSAKVFPKGSVGIAMYGATIGKLSIWGIDASTNQACAVAQPFCDVCDAEFLYYFLLSERRALVKEGQGGAQPNISQGLLKGWRMKMPPFNEQRRIVAKIEELFSELDKGVESLKLAREQLKLYRQSVLKHAFEGKLTADWREANPDKLEDPETLLARIQAERDARYKQQLDDWNDAVTAWRANGEEGRKPSKPKRPKDLDTDLADIQVSLPELPRGWLWQRLGFGTCSPEYGTSAKSAETGAVPVVRMGNLQMGVIDWGDLVFTSDKDEIAKYRLRQDDVLFNRTNSPELVGKTAIYRGEREALFAGYLIRLNQVATTVSAQYATYFLNSHIAQQHGNTVKTDGVNQSNINGNKLQDYPFPYCSFEEQSAVVAKLDQLLSNTTAALAEIEVQLGKSEALRQSILKQAFSGKLVPQDPSDEPASVLLERIKADKATTKKPRRRRAAA